MKDELEKVQVAISAAIGCSRQEKQTLIEAYFAAAEEVRLRGKPMDMDEDEYAVYVDNQAFSMVPGSRSVMEGLTDAVINIYQAPSG